MDSEIVTRANATMMLAGMQPFGPGKLLGSPTGSLFWIGDSGYQFNIEKNLREWGNSEFKLKSNDLYITLTTMNEFSVSVCSLKKILIDRICWFYVRQEWQTICTFVIIIWTF